MHRDKPTRCACGGWASGLGVNESHFGQKSLSRSWGSRFDLLPSSSPPPSSALPLDPTHPSSAPQQELFMLRKGDRQPHDASIFVGSLPPNAEQQELATALTAHLSEYDEVKSIKVIRDSKGGVCAFVQCEDSTAAHRLLNVLHSAPAKPFMGRILRYEPARAFRSLLISYRAPTQTIFPTDKADDDSSPKQVTLDLPTSMRLWKSRNPRFVSIGYNAEALDPTGLHNYNDQPPGGVPDLLLSPLAFDAQTIRKIVDFFGPLEVFEPYVLSALNASATVNENAHNQEDEAEIRDVDVFPVPHNALRESPQDIGCWTIKWRHREDCISALMTLRRVPHLTVTWAHPQSGVQQDHHTGYQHNAPYPLHVQPRSIPGANAQTDYALPPRFPVVTGLSGFVIPALSQQQPSSPSMADNNIHNVKPPGSARVGTSHSFSSTLKQTWGDSEFPPLSNMQEGGQRESLPWGDSGTILPLDKRSVELSPALTNSTLPSSRRSTASKSSVNSVVCDEGQEIDVLGTPELGMSPITPDTSNSLFPVTPSASSGDLTSFNSYSSKGMFGSYGGEAPPPKEIDPTTIFVGGLEIMGPGAWDQEKVERYFSRFGIIEDVTVVRPAGQRSAFAFVKFDNTVSPARAVREEHNRLHEGRQMRVQLRDCNPPRAIWKTTRGRGRGGMYPTTPRNFSAPMSYHVVNSNRPDLSVSTQSSSEIPPAPKPTIASMPDAVEYPSIATSYAHGTSSYGPLLDETLGGRPAGNANVGDGLRADKPREYHDATNPVSSTPPAGSTPASGPMPFNGYYAPQPWMHPVYPYPVPAMPGYNGAAPMGGHMYGASPAGSDGSGTPAGSVTPAQGWAPPAGMYAPFVQYPPYAPAAAPPRESEGQAQKAEGPPLTPAGFYQNEQGALVAVYNPEALGYYMSGHGVPGIQPQRPQPWLSMMPPAAYCVPFSPSAATGNHPMAHTMASPGVSGWMQAPHPMHGPMQGPGFRPAYGEQASPGGNMAPGKHSSPPRNRGHPGGPMPAHQGNTLPRPTFNNRSNGHRPIPRSASHGNFTHGDGGGHVTAPPHSPQTSVRHGSQGWMQGGSG